MRIALIHISQETNTFNPAPTTLDDYRSFGVYEGRAVLDNLTGKDQISGYLDAIRASSLSVETVPIIRGYAVAGGRITRDAFDFFADRISTGLKDAGPLDGVMVHIHGACAAEHLDDVEGAQLELCRAIVGKNIPIVAAIDHHANITHKMIDNSSAIVGHRTQPHDLYDTGKVGAEVLLRIVADGAQPVTAWRKIPLLSHQEQFLTSKSPMKDWFDQARALEKDPRVLQASTYPMQPWLDVEEGGWSAVVVTDDDPALAEKLVDELADFVWSMRDRFQVRESVPADQALRLADAAGSGLVVISDTGDTVFGGAAGDSNVLLESYVRQGIASSALIPMILPKTVKTLADAGEGAEVTIALGGETAREFFTPVTVTGIVRKVADGSHVEVNHNHENVIDMGQVVIFEVGAATLLITEKRGVAGNLPSSYRAFGVEPSAYKMAVLKTASNFQFFAELQSQLIRADTKGPGQSDVKALPWKRIPRPIYPLDDVIDWRGARDRGSGSHI